MSFSSPTAPRRARPSTSRRSEEHTSELQSQSNLVCRLLLEKKKKTEIQPAFFPARADSYWTVPTSGVTIEQAHQPLHLPTARFPFYRPASPGLRVTLPVSAD